MLRYKVLRQNGAWVVIENEQQYRGKPLVIATFGGSELQHQKALAYALRLMDNALVVSGSLGKARSDLDEAAHALSNYLETKNDEESVAWLHNAIEATVRAVASVSLAVERLAELPVCESVN